MESTKDMPVQIPETAYSQQKEAPLTPVAKVTTSAAKAVQEIVKRQLSGRITIGDPLDNSIFWRVYVGNGQVHFATSVVGQKERLSYLLRRYYPDLEHLQLKDESDYEFFCRYWQSGKLSLQQVRKLIFSLTQEALVQILALPQAEIQFEKTLGLDHLLLAVPFKETVLPVRRLISQWGQMRSHIASPLQRPFVKSLEHFSQLLWKNTENPQWIQLLSDTLNGNRCIYEVASALNMDVLELAKTLQPLVAAGAVGINSYRQSQNDERPIIACIDDSKTVQRNVKLTLEASGYRVLGLTEPTRALTALARYKPALILMDISMPEIDGYELCQLLRQSTLLKEIPIVMLTGREGLIDRLRARMVGANDYITKPFTPQQLFTVVNKLASSSREMN